MISILLRYIMLSVIKHYQLIGSMGWIISGPGCTAYRSFREAVKRTENASKQNEFHYQVFGGRHRYSSKKDFENSIFID